MHGSTALGIAAATLIACASAVVPAQGAGPTASPLPAVRTAAYPTPTPTIDPAWTPSPAVFPVDVAITWCRFLRDLGDWIYAIATPLLYSEVPPPDLATAQAIATAALGAERPAAEALRADLSALRGYEPTAHLAALFDSYIEAIEGVYEAWLAADEDTDLARLAAESLDTYTGVFTVLGPVWRAVEGAPEASCVAIFPELAVERPFPTPWPTAEPTASPTATPQATPPGSTTGWSWTRIAGEASVQDVATGGAGFVAVGRGDGRRAAWVSSDGVRWNAGTVEGADSGSAWLSGVSSYGPGYLAVGPRPEAATDLPDFGGAAVWTSTDGLDWRLSPASPTAADADIVPNGLSAVVARGDRVVAGGYADADACPLWGSDDGRTWQALCTDADDSGIAWQGGTASATGFVFVGRPTGSDVVRFSPDGVTWIDGSGFAGPETDSYMIDEIAAAPDGSFVAVGTADGRAAAWSASDGRTWVRADVEPPRVVPDEPPFDASTMRAASWAGDRWVAVGYTSQSEIGGAIGTGVVWTSVDGRSWRLEPEDPTFGGAVLCTVTAAEARLVVTGGRGCGGTVWSRPLAAWAPPATSSSTRTPAPTPMAQSPAGTPPSTAGATPIRSPGSSPVLLIVAALACMSVIAGFVVPRRSRRPRPRR